MATPPGTHAPTPPPPHMHMHAHHTIAKPAVSQGGAQQQHKRRRGKQRHTPMHTRARARHNSDHHTGAHSRWRGR